MGLIGKTDKCHGPKSFLDARTGLVRIGDLDDETNVKLSNIFRSINVVGEEPRNSNFHPICSDLRRKPAKRRTKLGITGREECRGNILHDSFTVICIGSHIASKSISDSFLNFFLRVLAHVTEKKIRLHLVPRAFFTQFKAPVTRW